MKPDQQADIIRRLRSTAGHLAAVTEMTEAGQPCDQVLHQLNAVRATLRAAGVRFVLCQVQNTQAVIMDSPSPAQRIAELKRLQSLYTILIEYSDYNNEVIHD